MVCVRGFEPLTPYFQGKNSDQAELHTEEFLHYGLTTQVCARHPSRHFSDVSVPVRAGSIKTWQERSDSN